jgi:DNA repair protein RadD
MPDEVSLESAGTSDFADGSPGYTITKALRNANKEHIEALLGTELINGLEGLDAALVCKENLQQIALQLLDTTEAFLSPPKRNCLIALLPLQKARELSARLGRTPKGDIYKDLMRAAEGAATIQAIKSFFGVPESRHVVSQQAAFMSTASPRYALFDHQNRAALQVEACLAVPPRKAVLHMPTGSGKTRTAMHVISRHLSNHSATVVAWFAQSSELLEQAASEFENAWQSLGNRSVSVTRFWGANQGDLSDVCDGLVVAGLAKMHALYARNPNALLQLADRTTLTVLDEAHQAVAPTYQHILEVMHGKRPINQLLGLTATPGRTWANVDEDRRLSDFFGKNKVSLTIPGYDNPVSYLIAEGYLANPVFKLVKVATQVRHALTTVSSETDLGDYPDTLVESYGRDSAYTLAIVNTVLELARQHDRIIVFAASVDHAKLVSSILSVRGVESSVVTGATPSPLRHRIISRFRAASPGVQVLCNYGVLTTGFDAPSISAAVIGRPTMSLVLYSQMVGRATRGPRAGGNVTAEIVTIVDPSLPGFGSVAEAFMNWEDVWNESTTANQR